VPPVSSSSPRYQALIQLLRTAEDLWNASRLFFARWSLSPSTFNVLNVLRDEAEGLSQSELSRLLIMHRSNVTGLVDRLETRALVRRLPNPEDRRAYRVVLTPAGIQLLDDIYPHYFAAAEQVWSDVPPERVEALLAELQNLALHAAVVGNNGATAPPLPVSRNAKRSWPRNASEPSVQRGEVDPALDGLRITDL
jgi:DNA-binding MarR family transcriptional regulator